MISFREQRRVARSPGYSWVKSHTSTPDAIRDLFGPRLFPAHVATVGYDYDFHRGIDVPFAALGDPVYAGMAGVVVRKHHTHFDFSTADQFAKWNEVDADSTATIAVVGGKLRFVGSRVGAKAITRAAQFRANTERVNISTGDWEVRAKLDTNPSMSGGVVGFGVVDAVNNQYAAIEYDGATSTARGTHTAGVLTADGTTSAATAVYLSVTYTQATDTITWRRSNDAITWTNVATQASVAFSREGWPAFTPFLYYRSLDTNAATNTVDVSSFGWYDSDTIPRFGNWITIVGTGEKVIQMHMQDIAVDIGAIVEAGQLIGYAGATGFDARSGPIGAVHCHLEYAASGAYIYALSQPINPLGVGLLPRTNVSNNVSVTRGTENDPDGVDSHVLDIVVLRGDQDFDLDTITVVASTTSRTISFNSRTGLAVDNDVPKFQGMYLKAFAFDETSLSYRLKVYANKSIVGNTWTSGQILDTAGTVLWSG